MQIRPAVRVSSQQRGATRHRVRSEFVPQTCQRAGEEVRRIRLEFLRFLRRDASVLSFNTRRRDLDRVPIVERCVQIRFFLHSERFVAVHVSYGFPGR